MSRTDDTAEIAPDAEVTDGPSAEEPVGRVNLPDEPEDDGVADDEVAGDLPHDAVVTLPGGQLREKVLYGLLAAALMVLAMFVILQGVFEQKMPV